MSSGLRLLLVSDHAVDDRAVEAFEGFGDAVELTVCGHDDALTYLRDDRSTLPDLVLMQLCRPDVSDFALLSDIKSDPTLALLPVVVMCASSQPEQVRRAYLLRASAYVVRAHQSAAFLRQIGALVGFWSLARVTGRPVRAAS